MKRMIDVLFDNVIANILKFLSGSLAVIILLQIFSRIFLTESIAWTEEVSRLLFIWFCAYGSVLACKKNMHIGIDYLYIRANKKVRKFLDFCIYSLITTFGAILLVYGIRLLDIVSNQTTELLRWPSSVYYSSVPVSGALFIIFALSRITELFQNKEDLS